MTANGQSETTPREGSTGTIISTLLPIATLQAAFTNATSFQVSETSAAAAAAVIGSAMGERATAMVPRRGRMKFKDQGILAHKQFFLHPEKLESYPSISSSFCMTGKISVVPRREVVDYRFFWSSSNLPSSFNERDLRTKVCKADKTSLNILKPASSAYDEKYPDHTPTKSKSKSKSRSPVSSATLTPPDPWHVSQQRLKGVCMSQLLDPLDRNQPPPTDTDYAYATDSVSDDGSDVGKGNTYSP